MNCISFGPLWMISQTVFFPFQQVVQIIFCRDAHQHINIGESDIRVENEHLEPFFFWSDRAKFKVKFDLPTPPFPLVTVMIRVAFS